jgi:hypothetical protein
MGQFATESGGDLSKPQQIEIGISYAERKKSIVSEWFFIARK